MSEKSGHLKEMSFFETSEYKKKGGRHYFQNRLYVAHLIGAESLDISSHAHCIGINISILAWIWL